MVRRRPAAEKGPFSDGPSLTTVTKPTGVQQGTERTPERRGANSGAGMDNRRGDQAVILK